jgi:hypothetical protein
LFRFSDLFKLFLCRLGLFLGFGLGVKFLKLTRAIYDTSKSTVVSNGAVYSSVAAVVGFVPPEAKAKG